MRRTLADWTTFIGLNLVLALCAYGIIWFMPVLTLITGVVLWGAACVLWAFAEVTTWAIWLKP